MAQRSIYLFLRQPTLISCVQFNKQWRAFESNGGGPNSSRRLNEGLPGEDRWIGGGSWGGERWMVEVLLAALVVVAECSSSLLVRIGTWMGSLLGQRLMEERPEDNNQMLRTTIHQWSRGDDTE
ncbi:hypothetical protein HYALB_00003493 [Hymenoscyphus albidus]|uniref:Uncharacterized protein n=1 Tax=Hymenoscyphus albidus TaxID=595503 RepID=A0A9N9LQR7_9HELO|nr:hypothetical protein HYALB_00003493 [Hymenoscyphus albidus]